MEPARQPLKVVVRADAGLSLVKYSSTVALQYITTAVKQYSSTGLHFISEKVQKYKSTLYCKVLQHSSTVFYSNIVR